MRLPGVRTPFLLGHLLCPGWRERLWRWSQDPRYVRNGGTAIAYQVLGGGETDLVYVPDYMSNLVFGWQYPRWRDFYLRLAESFRLILFDKRGTGLSDHGGQFATLETRWRTCTLCSTPPAQKSSHPRLA